jgi:3-oxoadipate enol-lactonase
MWDPQVSALSARFRLVRYDRRGHGRSPVPDGPYSLDDLGGDVLDLLDELGLDRVSFCGLSIGGMVGMWLAVNAPERIDRLVLCCTACALPPREHWLKRAEIVRGGGVAAVADAVLARWFPHEVPAQLVERHRQQLLSTPAEGYAGCCEALADIDLGGRLAEIGAPTLILSGEADSVAPPERGDELAAGIPGARHVTLRDAGHIANAEQPEQFTQHLLAHLTEEAR